MDKSRGFMRQVGRLGFAILALFALLGCGSGHRLTDRPVLESDAKFHQRVLQKMPGLKLTARQLGHKVVPAPAYAFLDVNTAEQKTPNEHLAQRLEAFEEAGMKAATLYFYGGASPDGDNPWQVWRTSFPRCAPMTCVQTAREVKLQKSSAAAFERHKDSFFPSRFITLLEEKVDGVPYHAEIEVFYDAQKRVQRYRVRERRETISGKETTFALSKKLWRERPYPDDLYWFTTGLYSHNLVFGLEMKTRDPELKGQPSSQELARGL